ncbi:MAG: exo-alpha-sialidase [Bacteroidales bacterium]|nr:exo-alpha-sialidase [Bacteroidales bacterium]
MEIRNYHMRYCLKYLSICILPIGLCLGSCKTKVESDTDIKDPITTLKLMPSENNPRNSEGDFINLKDGRILFIYSHFYGSSSSDHAHAFLAGRFSNDGGRTWTEEDEVIIPNEGGMNVMSVSLLRLQNGDIALFYLQKNSLVDCTPQMRISKDDANTWSEPVPIITDKKGYFVLNNDRVIQLKDGRLLLAVALHATPDRTWNDKGDLYSYYFDDDGQTWLSSDKVPDTTDIITQEPGLIELKDGRIMMYIRGSGGYQQLSFSPDQGNTWSHIETSHIPSPLSPATIEIIPGTDDWLMVWNNNDGSNPEIEGKRTPLTTAISKDEGKTWHHVKNICNDPDGWYCYIAIHFDSSDFILLSNCAGNQPQGTGLSITDITLIEKAWLYE